MPKQTTEEIFEPYQICCVENCTKYAVDPHHEPARPFLRKEHYNRKTGVTDKRYIRYMCRRHHEERERLGYKKFKKKYPKYDGVSLEEYRKK